MGTATRQESPSVRSDGRPPDRGNLIGPGAASPMSFAAAPGLKIETTKGGLILVAPDHPPKRIRLVVDGAEPSAAARSRARRASWRPRRRGRVRGGRPRRARTCGRSMRWPGRASPRGGTVASCACRTRRPSCASCWISVGLAQAVPCAEGSGLEVRGSPKGGKNRAVSRKNVIPLIRSPESSSTWSDHGVQHAGSPLGLYCPNAGEPLAMVGTRRESRQPIPGRGTTRRCPRGSGATGRTAACSRSRPRAKERGERVHVVALEGVDVARQERSLLLVHRFRRLRAIRVGRGERRPSALEGAVDRCDRRVEQLRDLVRLPAQHLAQDEHRALLRRQVLERGHEREADRLPRHGHLGRVAAVGHDPTVGHRLDPGGLRKGGGQRRVGAPTRARGPSGGRGAGLRSACSGTRSSRCGTATIGAPRVPRTDRCHATRARASPAPRPRPRRPIPACGSSTRSARRDTAPAATWSLRPTARPRLVRPSAHSWSDHRTRGPAAAPTARDAPALCTNLGPRVGIARQWE